MRILFLAAKFHPHVGGVETAVRELAHHAKAAGHHVLIISNRHPRSLAASEQLYNIPIQRITFSLPSWAGLRSSPLRWLRDTLYLPISVFLLWQAVRTFKPDVINLHFLGSQALALWLVHHIIPTRLIVTLQGADVDHEPQQSPFRRWLFEAVCSRANSVNACSKQLLQQAQELYPPLLSKGCTIHNGVDSALFSTAVPYQQSSPYLFAVGRLEIHKGFDLLLHAFAASDQSTQYTFIIAGAGNQQIELQALAERLGISKCVVWLGNQASERVAAYMAGASAIIIPSRREPFGIVAVEALATGRPIIAAQVGGLPEALEGAEVRWFKPDDAADLACALAELADNPPTSAHNRALAQQRSWSAVSAAYLALFAAPK